MSVILLLAASFGLGIAGFSWLGPEPSVHNSVGFLLLSVPLIYGAFIVYQRMYIRQDEIVWRRQFYWGWHRFDLKDIKEFMLSPGNAFNQPIIVMFLYDGREIWARMPVIPDEQRDEAFKFFRRAVTAKGGVEVPLLTRR